MQFQNKRMARMLSNFVPAIIRSRFRPTPVWVMFYLTRRCNLSCKYCYAKDNSAPELDTTQVFRVIDKLQSLGCGMVGLFGGEPTLRRDLPEIVHYVYKKGMITHLSTNGTMLTLPYIEKLARAGLDIFNLSIDSVYEYDVSNKDYTTQKRVLSDLLEMREKYGFEINAAFVLSRMNYNIAGDTVRLMHKSKIPIAIAVVTRNTGNPKAKQDEGLFFTTSEDKENLYRALDELIEMKKHGYNIMNSTSYFSDSKKHVDGKYDDWDCTAGKYTFSVDSNGEFQICSGLPTEKVSIFDIDENYYKIFAESRNKQLRVCRKICMTACMYDTGHYQKHPWEMFR
jgi:MoaA/NifB/PqqE/SkfB family radical SAM enzyme